MPPRVLIVDDHPGFRAWVRAMLEEDGLQVVGEASTGAEALHLAGTQLPDLVLLDVQLPDASGFDVAEQLSSGRAIVVLTSSREAGDYRRRLASTSAAGFVPKAALTGLRLTSFVEGAG